jgi:hypothetical protein
MNHDARRGMKVKVSEATPIQLDWLVSKAENDMAYKNYTGQRDAEYAGIEFYKLCWEGRVGLDFMRYSTDWAQGGPIIEREGLTVVNAGNLGHEEPWMAAFPKHFGNHSDYIFGATPLIAAMRCFCASKLGDTVEVPEELT